MIKAGKAPDSDGFADEGQKKGGVTVIEWIVRWIVSSLGPINWHISCIVLLYQGNRDNYEWSNFSGISLLCVDINC